MENIILNELKIRGFNVDAGVIMQYDTNEKGNSIRKQMEIDFVCTKRLTHHPFTLLCLCWRIGGTVGEKRGCAINVATYHPFFTACLSQYGY